MFTDVILLTTESVQSSKDIRSYIVRHMELWYQSQFVALVDNTVTTRQGGGDRPIQGGSAVVRKECAAQA